MLRAAVLAGLVATLAGISPNNPAPAAFAEETVYAAVPLAPQGAVEAPAVSSSNGTTTLYIQNKEANAGSVFVTFYKEDGTSIDITACLAPGGNAAGTPIAANGPLTLDYGTCSALADGDKGASVVSSDVDVAVIEANSYTNRTSGATSGISGGANIIMLPALVKAFGSQSNATIYIQNVESITRTATLQFFKEGVSGAIFTTTATLPPFTGKTFDLGSDALFNISAFNNYRGSGRIFGEGGVGLFIAEVDIRNNAAGLGSTDVVSQRLMSYGGFVSSATNFYLPIIRRNVANYSTSIQIANFNNSAATVNLQFIGGPANPNKSALVTATVQANNSIYYNQGTKNGSGLYNSPPEALIGASWNGSVIATSTLPIQITVKDDSALGSANRGSNGTYKGFTMADASNEVFLPLLRNAFSTAKFGTNVRIQNLNTTTATIRIDYVPSAGSPSLTSDQSWDEVQIGPFKLGGFGQFANFNRPASPAITLPTGFIGTGYLRVVSGSGSTTLDPNGKIVVLVNDISRTSVTADSFDQGSYEGIKK